MKIDSVKIFGERHTGTNALSLFIRENFDLKFKYYEFLGWKHRLAPKKVEWIKYDTNNILFIFLFRNPYTWLNSMYKEPYYHHYLKINDRSFEEFLKFSIETSFYIFRYSVETSNFLCIQNLKRCWVLGLRSTPQQGKFTCEISSVTRRTRGTLSPSQACIHSVPRGS